MSQEKIDKRKQNRGDLLHNTKKHMRITTLIVAVVLVVAGAFSSVISYNKGYDKGEKDGEINMLNLQSLLGGSTTNETSAEGETGETSGETSENETGETEGVTTSDETSAEDETTAE